MTSVALLIHKAARDPRTAGMYLAFAACALVVYVWLSYSGFAFYDHYLTLAAAMQSLAFVLLGAKIKADDTTGISPNMMVSYILAYVARLSTTMTMNGYMPEDATADIYLYQISELIGLVVLAVNLWKFLKMRAANVMMMDETSKENKAVVPLMVIASFALAALTKSDGHGHYVADLLWMFSQWMDTFAIAPQLWLVTQQRLVERRTSHFIALMISSRFVLSFFWVMILWAHPLNWGFTIGMALSSALHVVLSADYLYYFVTTIRQPNMVLPGVSF